MRPRGLRSPVRGTRRSGPGAPGGCGAGDGWRPGLPKRRDLARVAGWAASLIAVLVVPVWAQDPAPGAAEPDTSLRAGEPEAPVLGMSLEQALRLAIASSPATRAALAGVRSARGARMKEAAAFDPVLIAEGQRVSTDSPVTSPFAASALRQRSVSGGLAWLSPLGTSLSLTLSRATIESNAPFSTLPRERRTRARADFVQPLGRGFGPAAARGELRATDRELEAARARLEAAAVDLRADVENAYWELYASERDLSVQRLQRQRAAIFLRDQILRGRAGVVGPGAVAVARTFLADQEAALLDARLGLDAASDRLAERIGIPPGGQARLHCLDEPQIPAAIDPLEAVLERAIRHSPTLLTAELDAAAARARLGRASRNLWPALEAFGGYGASGLAGTGRQVVFGDDTVGKDFDSGFDDAWRDVRDRDNPDWSFGLRARVPIGWRAERGERERQRGAFERAQEALRAHRLALESAVRRAHREARTAGEALRAMSTLVAAAREQARIARLEYQAGRATAYDLVDLEAQLARAEFRESQTLVRAARSITELRRLTQPGEGSP